ncbi:hypothetical protein NUU61_000881 [Penicillium alfredii]|uniref:Uncharacterized protein n=1 Tax=Penicillium alfredii TaxID=1506179 RepID=A0A9W9GAR9_9EURO|nr:uncharacterized protein NUU61_000881 [Penicillium alfredii]KAJ5115122.1 hypothetical protein NUU61_000881 [Penicillium alfredii]
MAPKKDEPLPRTWSDWAKAAKNLGVYRASVHTRENFQSGTNVTREEHLLLRALWTLSEDDAIPEEELGLGPYFEDASRWLDDFVPFAEYLKGIENSSMPGVDNMGIFETAYSQQFQVRKFLHEKKDKDKKGLDGINEEIVNASLISFLTAICLKNPNVQAYWTPHRATLTATFKKAKLAKQTSLNCQIDGFLAANKTAQTQVILEAKADNREIHEPNVTMQETYEIVAALLTDAPKGLPMNRVILISQDGEELYLSNATYTDEYKSYMMGTKRGMIKKTEFLRIQRYGPWRIKHWKEVEKFAKLVLAIALRASAEQP